jgi:aspartate/methionine/tyrosine aminotransferase
MSKFKFGFGDSVAVAQAATYVLNWRASRVFEFHPTYPPIEGFEKLNDLTRKLVHSLTGKEYRYVLITHGATGALNLILRDMINDYPAGLHIDPLHFIYYPMMAARTGHELVDRDAFLKSKKMLQLTALPSNPEGKLETDGTSAERTIWDACYFSPVYMNQKLHTSSYLPKHVAMVGSFGKLLGYNGVRLGWVATDDKQVYQNIMRDQVAETMGVSTLGCALVTNTLEGMFEGDGLEGQKFYARARGALNNNRDAVRRLEKLGHRPVPENGMFWFTEIDTAARMKFDKAGVDYIDGKHCGSKEQSIRINLGQDEELTGEMVKAVLKADRVRK